MFYNRIPLHLIRRARCSCKRYRRSMLVLITWAIGILVLLFLYRCSTRRSRVNLINTLPTKTEPKLIDTIGCSTPFLSLYDEVSTRLLKKPPVIKACAEIKHLVERNATHLWKVKENEKYYNKLNSTNTATEPVVQCFYQPFYRPLNVENVLSLSVDERVTYGPRFELSIIKPIHEFIYVECEIENNVIYDNFYLFAQKKHCLSQDKAVPLPQNNSVYNVLIIGLDSVSRLNLHRALPKTVDYIKKLGAVELLGYNKIGDNTFPNIVGILLGITENEINHTCYPNSGGHFDNCPFVWKWYRQNGYFTAFAEDVKEGIFNYNHRGFIHAPTDYYTHTFMYESAMYNITNHNWCQDGLYPHQIMLNYIGDLTTALNDVQLFGFFWESLISHGYLQNAKLLESDYFNLFKRFNDSNYLNQSIIFFISDHGMRFGEYVKTPPGRMESMLPFVFILAPQSFRSKYKEAYKNLMINSRRLTTPLDLHETLMDLITLKSITDSEIITRSNELNYGNKIGITLFLPILETRTCGSAGIEDTWCSCYNGKSIPVTAIKVFVGAKYMMKHLNKMMFDHYECADLEISNVIDAMENITVYNSTDQLMKIVVEAKPGGGIFEGTLRQDKNQLWEIAGPINRLNEYGKQGFCVDDYHLKMYCYCEKNAEGDSYKGLHETR